MGTELFTNIPSRVAAADTPSEKLQLVVAEYPFGKITQNFGRVFVFLYTNKRK